MQRRTLSVLAALAAALPLTTQADTMDYSFVDLGYVDTELDDVDVDGDGFASARLACFPSRTSSHSPSTRTWASTSASTSRFKVGVGGHLPLNEKIDLVGRSAS